MTKIIFEGGHPLKICLDYYLYSFVLVPLLLFPNRLWQRYLQNWWKCTTEMPQGVSFRICLKRCSNVLMGQHGLVSVRYSCNALVQHCCDVPLRRLGKVPPRRSWVFQLWLVCREHVQTVCRCYVLFRRCQHVPS